MKMVATHFLALCFVSKNVFVEMARMSFTRLFFRGSGSWLLLLRYLQFCIYVSIYDYHVSRIRGK
jgi:hypothetical protein